MRASALDDHDAGLWLDRASFDSIREITHHPARQRIALVRSTEIDTHHSAHAAFGKLEIGHAALPRRKLKKGRHPYFGGEQSMAESWTQASRPASGLHRRV
jgi:hypothetical protein